MAAHWADDQVAVELQRRPGGRMEVRELQEATGLGPRDLEECLTGLGTEGAVVEEGSEIIWVPEADRKSPEEPDPSPPVAPPVAGVPVPPSPVSPPMPPASGNGVSLPSVMTGLLEEARDGTPFRVTAEAVIETGPNGELSIVGIRRVLGVERVT